MLVLVVSSYLLFQNVYTTFKALGPPKVPRKSKPGTEPTAKAKNARKRELKGMLACWVVWSCWTSAEAIADRTIAVLTPFYNEIKMFLVLFLILGRTTMSETILINVIRPLVRPYYVSLDSLVDLFTSAAGFGVLFFTAPLTWIKLVTRQVYAVFQKTFAGASSPRTGDRAVSSSGLDEPIKPEAGSTREDPRERFVPKTRGLSRQELDVGEPIYKNPLRDEPPPYGVPDSIERDYPPVFTKHGASRSRTELGPGGRPMYGRPIDHYAEDSSSATSVSYREESEVGTPGYGFSPSQGGAGDLAPERDPDVPSFNLSSPEHPPTAVVAAPAIPSYLQPRTRASRANLRPTRQRVDSYADRPNPRASAFLEGERGMTFADRPKEAKGLTPEVGVPVSPPSGHYGISSPPANPASPPYGNPYAPRGRVGYPTRPYSPEDNGSRVDNIQGWRERSAIPPDPKSRRAPSAGPGGSSYPYQAAATAYPPQSPSAAPSFPSPQIPMAFPTPSIAPSLTPSQSVSNVGVRPQLGYRPPSAGPDNRPPTVASRPPTNAPSHPPTSTTGMGLPRRQRSTRELRAQVWDPKEDNSAAEAERLREEERLAIEKKEADRIAALERQRRKVSDQRTLRGKQSSADFHSSRPRAVGTRSGEQASEGQGF